MTTAYNHIALTIEEIDPAQAATMLLHNTRNRPMKPATVNTYAKVMSSGDWTFTGESISFDLRGRLVNGQHRLSAVVKSGVPITVVVVRGVPDSAWGHTLTPAIDGPRATCFNTLATHVPTN